MEARNYSPNAQHNMILSDDAQIVAGVIGNGVYLPAGCGTVEMSGTLDAMGVSIWRMWDGVTETEGVRGIFSFKNFGAYFDNVSDKLTVMLPCGITVHTDIPDDTEFNHWVFNFIKNGTLSIYKNAVKVYEAQTAEDAVDLTDGFTLGGGRTHATFDEVYVHTELLKEEEVNGLCYLIRNGMPAQQIQEIAQSGAAKYLGVTETVPDNRGVLIVKGEQLGTVYANTGDWVLMSKTVGGWKTGVCYRWSGLMWINLEPEYNYEAQYQACLAHICEIPELTKETGHYGALFAKLLVTQKALIDSLVVKQLKIDADLSTDKNFEAYFDETHGLEITNEKKTILRIPPKGDSVFTGKVNVGAVQLLDSGVFIKDGEISIENNGWKGSLRPCDNGVEFAIMSQGEDGAMTKQQMRTVIRNGVLSLFVLGSISCENIYRNNTAGQNWVQGASPVGYNFYNLAYDNGRWVAIGAHGSIITSTDGITWTKISVPTNRDLIGLAYGNGIWIATGSYGVLLTSTDGITWTKISVPTNEDLSNLVYGNGIWIATGSHGVLITSTDGITWTKKDNPFSAFSLDAPHGFYITYTDGIWIAMNSCYVPITSTDGITWTKIDVHGGAPVYWVTRINGMWIAAGSYGVFFTSTDGITWTKIDIQVKEVFRDVSYGNGMWIITSNLGLLLTSTDGITWTKRTNPTNRELLGLVYGNGIWVAKNRCISIITSTDGITWTKRSMPTNKDLNCLAYGNGMWVIAGEDGIILRSADQTATWTMQ